MEENDEKMSENNDFWELHQEIETVIVPNKELSGLVLDDDFGMRWKNGAFDRRVRGDGKKMDVAPDQYDVLSSVRNFVTEKKMFEFISKYMMMYDDICELEVKNSIIIDSISDGEIAYYDAVIRETMDVDCCNVKKTEYEYFLYRMKVSFLKHSKTMLNSLASVSMYAKFTGEKENTIRKWIERDKLDLVYIAGTKFIFVREDELMLWNAFLMEESLSKEVCENREKLSLLYKKLYGRKPPQQMDSVLAWTLYWGLYPESSETTSYYGKMHTMKAYEAYCAYCKDNKIDSISSRLFGFRITSLGFKRFAGKRRGFLYWKGEEL